MSTPMRWAPPTKAPNAPTTSDQQPKEQGLLVLALILLPAAAAFGPWASLNPGAAGQLYALRAILLLLLPAAWLALQSAPRPRPLALILWWPLSVGLLAWGAIGLSWTPDTGRAMRDLLGLAIALTSVFVIVHLLGGHAGRINAMRRGWVVAAVATSMVALWEIRTGQHLVTENLDMYLFQEGTVASTFVNPNNFAAFLNLTTLPMLRLMGTSKNTLFKMACAGMLLSNGYLITLTGSRAGIAVFVLIILGGLAILSLMRTGVLLIALMAIGLGVAMVWNISPTLIPTLFNRTFSDDTAESDERRQKLADAAQWMIGESEWMGFGPGSFEAVLPDVPSTIYADRILPAHNTILQIGAEYGIVLMLLTVGLILTLAMAGLRNFTAALRVEAFELLGVVTYVVTAALVASSVLADPIWWVAIAYGIALSWTLVIQRSHES